MSDLVIYWKPNHHGDSKHNFFRNFSRKKCREYLQHALVFVRRSDSDTQHSNTKPNENLNYVFFRQKKLISAKFHCDYSIWSAFFCIFKPKKTHWNVSHELWQKLCGKYKESFSTWRDELEMVICLTAVICPMFGMFFPAISLN